MNTSSLPLSAWITQQAARSAQLMQGGISATHLTKVRAVFGTAVHPAKGSVLASPVDAAWDPEPDYFFHWPRDAAHVMHALTVLAENARTTTARNKWNRHFSDIVDFSLKLNRQDGRAAAAAHKDRVKKTGKQFRQYLRPADALAAITSDTVQGEPRFDPDGRVSILKWAGPQYDGVAARAHACMDHMDFLKAQKLPVKANFVTLIRQDIEFTIRHADKECIGLWEEDNEYDHHYYTVAAQWAALSRAVDWARAQGDAALSEKCRIVGNQLARALEKHWQPQHSSYKYLRARPVHDVTDGLDSAIIMAANHGRQEGLRHSPMDDRMQATLGHLTTMFAGRYPINRNRPADVGVAYGRYRDDKYFSGGAYFFSTLAVAEFYYRLAALVPAYGGIIRTPVNADFRKQLGLGGDVRSQAQALIDEGDKIMAMVRLYTPADGSLAEQFDQATGEPRSAQHLTWSYAAFITAADARQRAIEAVPAAPAAKPQPL